MTRNGLQADKATDFTVLVVRAQNGDNAAFDTLAERFRSFAAAFALARVNDPGLAQDAVQDAFLEAWVCLPRLQHPAAFPAFLRRILLKRCDRLTRGKHPAVSLETVVERPAETPDPTEAAEANRQRRIVATALTTLSPQDRTALLLHYAGGESLAEVAAFLGLTVATVKSRLHRARQRLREKITHMEDTVRELLSNYQNQVHLYATANGPKADRSLLERARRQFDQEMAERASDAPLDTFTVHLGFSLFQQMQNRAAQIPLLDRYLSQPLSPSQELWARWHRTNALCFCLRHAEAVATHRELRTFYSSLTKPPLLCHAPIYRPDREPFMTPEEQALWLLMPIGGQSSISLSWLVEGVAAEWQAWAEETLARAPATEESRHLRTAVRQTLKIFTLQRGMSGRENLMARFRDEARREGDTTDALRWEIERENTLLNEARLAKDDVALRCVGERIVALVRDLPPRDHRRWIAAHQLVFAGLFDLALPIVEAYVQAENTKTDWIWLVEYAVCLWKVTGDKARTASLLRQAQEQRRRHENHPELTEQSVWRMNGMDAVPEFVAAVA